MMFIAGPDEQRPWEAPPYPHPLKLLQYFRKARGTWGNDLRAMVNGRSRYWKSSQKVPGGVAFENLAVIEDFKQGQKIFFGIFNGTVEELLEGREPRP
jgi:hypothetical protein